MKRWLTFVIIAVLILSLSVCLFSCNSDENKSDDSDDTVNNATTPDDEGSGGQDDTGDADDNTGDADGNTGDADGNTGGVDDGDTDDPSSGDNSGEVEDLSKTVRLSLIEKGTGDLIKKTQYNTGYILTAEDIADIKATFYHGYGYAKWYPEKGGELTEGLVLNEDTVILCDRGNLAGENITWDFTPVGETSSLILSGSGPMFDFEFNDDAPWIALAPFISEIVFDGEITSVGDCSFYGFSALDKVILPDGLVKIGERAFYNSSVTDIVFPDSLKYIGVNAFYKCQQLTELNFNVGLEYIGNGAFYECINIVNVILTDKIAELGNSAFFKNTNLQTAYYVGTKEQYDNMLVRLDNFWVKELANTYFISTEQPAAPGPYWYYGEDGSVQQWYYTIGYMSSNGKVPFAFDYVDPVEGFSQDNIDFINSIVYHGYKFARWYYNGQSNKYADFSVGDKLDGDIRLRGERGNICGDGLTYSWRNGVLTISGVGRMWDFENENDAPWEKRNISKVIIEDGVEYIGSYAFCDKAALTYIDIPTGVKKINVDAFSGCINLKYVYYLGTYEQMQAVDGLSALENIDRATVYSYNADDTVDEGYFWRYVTGLVTEGEKRVAWGIEDGVLTVGGDTALVNYNSPEQTPWYSKRESIVAVSVIEGANRIGSHTFENLHNVTSITLPDTVLKISKTAFIGTEYYSNSDNWVGGALYISNHLIKVDPEKAGETFIIKNDIISIAEDAFKDCETVKNLVFSKDIIGVYRGVLSDLTSLENIFTLHTARTAWENVWVSGNDLPSQEIDDVQIYFFSKFEPTDENLLWWRYVDDGGVSTVAPW